MGPVVEDVEVETSAAGKEKRKMKTTTWTPGREGKYSYGLCLIEYDSI